MKLEDKSTKELLALHNTIADSPAGPKTFATRAKLITRIGAVAAAKRIDLATHTSPGEAAVDSGLQPNAAPDTAEARTTPKKRGLGIGELARTLIMNSAGYPHSLIAVMVNEQIPGATATDRSVRWYASKMRKDGIDVPDRAKLFAADMNEKQSATWLKTARASTPTRPSR